MREIKWIGSPNFNSGRKGIKPIAIVNHVSTGTLSSMDDWFNDPKNKNSSSHFGVGLDGTIHQYVKIEDFAWCQGIPIPEGLKLATAPIVKDMGCNPNYYCVSIEREGYYTKNKDDTETGEIGWLDGSGIPVAQFEAMTWLHRYIMDYLNNMYGVNMGLGEYNVLGHFQIDPVRKPLCPGLNFPWEELRAELAIAQTMTLADYEMRQQMRGELLPRPERVTRAMGMTNRVIDLYNKARDPAGEYADIALDKMDQIYGFLKEKNLLDA